MKHITDYDNINEAKKKNADFFKGKEFFVAVKELTDFEDVDVYKGDVYMKTKKGFEVGGEVFPAGIQTVLKPIDMSFMKDLKFSIAPQVYEVPDLSMFGLFIFDLSEYDDSSFLISNKKLTKDQARLIYDFA